MMKDKLYKIEPDLLFYILMCVHGHEPEYYFKGDNYLCVPLEFHDDDFLGIKDGYMMVGP